MRKKAQSLQSLLLFPSAEGGATAKPDGVVAGEAAKAKN
jgi:hypothetical protein